MPVSIRFKGKKYENPVEMQREIKNIRLCIDL